MIEEFIGEYTDSEQVEKSELTQYSFIVSVVYLTNDLIECHIFKPTDAEALGGIVLAGSPINGNYVSLETDNIVDYYVVVDATAELGFNTVKLYGLKIN